MNGSDDDAPPPKPEPAEPGHRKPDERSRHAHHDDTLGETIRQKLEQLVPDLVKKTFTAGLGAVFQTEEGIRRVAGAARENLPEVAGYIASSADNAKDKVFEVIARETREFLTNLNLQEELVKLLTTLSFEVKTEIRFIPNSERVTGAVPDVKASVRVKRNDERVETTRDKEREAQRDPKEARDREGTEDAGRDSRSRLRFWRRDDDAPPDEGEDHDK